MIENDRVIDEINKFMNGLSFLWEEEPLDGDATEQISKVVHNELNRINGVE